jgi:hypothetical protein
LRPGRSLIGRAPKSPVRLEDAKVSRRHAALLLSPAGLFIEDLNSRTGVTVDGVQVKSRHRLNPGARISVGDCELVVEIELDPATDPPPQGEGAATEVGVAFAAHREAAMRLLADGNFDEAAAIVESDLTSAGLLGRRASSEDLDGTARCALQLARTNCDAGWIGDVLRMYAEAHAPIGTAILADLQATAPVLGGIEEPPIRAYLAIVPQVCDVRSAEGAALRRSVEALLLYTHS